MVAKRMIGLVLSSTVYKQRESVAVQAGLRRPGGRQDSLHYLHVNTLSVI